MIATPCEFSLERSLLAPEPVGSADPVHGWRTRRICCYAKAVFDRKKARKILLAGDILTIDGQLKVRIFKLPRNLAVKQAVAWYNGRVLEILIETWPD
jgi:hypothetical protein